MNIPLLLIVLAVPTLILGGSPIGSPNLILAAGAMYVIGMAWGIGGLLIREIFWLRKKHGLGTDS